MRPILALIAALAPLPLAAHPHVFIDTGFEIILDANCALTHVRTTWAYDELYTLMISEDLKVDQDYDGKLTPEEEARLAGFDMQWVEGFNGDLEATLDGAPLVLSGPLEPTARIEGGRVITTHLRAVEGTPGLAGRASMVSRLAACSKETRKRERSTSTSYLVFTAACRNSP